VFVSEYGGKWKMLHYFAKKFFHEKILSAFVDRRSVSLYYIDDSIHRRTRGLHSIQTTHSQLHSSKDTEQSGSRLNDVSLGLSRFPSTLESWLKWSGDTSGDSWKHWREASVVDDMTVNFQQKVDNVDQLHSTQKNCTIMLQCFSWSSFQPRARWNITFPLVRLLTS